MTERWKFSLNDFVSEFGSIPVSGGSRPLLILTCVFLLAVPAVFWLVWSTSHKGQTRPRYFLIGAAGFVVSARILELGVHLVCIVTDNPVSRFINGSHAAYVLYGILMAGVFEECGRYIIMRFLLKKPMTRENAVLYGIGHGGIEVWTIALPSCVLYLVINILCSSGDAAALLRALNVTEETASALLPFVKIAAAFGPADGAVLVVERVLCMLLHIGFTVIVFFGVKNGGRKYLPAAILMHMAVDLFPALNQRGLVSIWVCELWLLLWSCIVCLTAIRLYKKAEGSSVQKGLSV